MRLRLRPTSCPTTPQVIFPEANRHDYEDLAADLREGLTAHFVSHYDQVGVCTHKPGLCGCR